MDRSEHEILYHEECIQHQCLAVRKSEPNKLFTWMHNISELLSIHAGTYRGLMHDLYTLSQEPDHDIIIQ